MRHVADIYKELDANLADRRLSAAETLLAEAREAGANGPRLDLREQVIARHKGENARALAAAERRYRQGDTTPRLPVNLMSLYLEVEDFASAEALLREFRGSNEDDPRPLVMEIRLAEAKGDVERFRQSATRFVTCFPARCEWHDWLGSLLTQVPVAESKAMSKIGLNRLEGLPATSLPDEASLMRPLVSDETRKDVLASEETGSEVVLVVLTGLADRATFPIEIFDRFPAALGLTTVYLKDFERLLYWHGVRSWGGTLGTRERLRELADGGRRRLVLVGSSGGGYGAIRWGLEANVAKVIGFSAPTNVDLGFLSDIGDKRGKIIAKRLNAEIPSTGRDLAALIAATGGCTKIELYFGAGNQTDIRHASNIEGLPGVSLHPVADVGEHAVLFPLVETGRFATYFKRMIDV